ncbi:MAG: hypothetical protein J7J38_00635 [Candidatus Aenigmarchaeota archaeon]|nr:hypothetical protein [Candidatus Aenigmarchaeota archaeon]
MKILKLGKILKDELESKFDPKIFSFDDFRDVKIKEVVNAYARMKRA